MTNDDALAALDYLRKCADASGILADGIADEFTETIRQALKSLEDERDRLLADVQLHRPTDLERADVQRLRQEYRKKLRELYGDADTLPMQISKLTAERDRLKAQLTEADEVIRPFAECLSRLNTNLPDDIEFELSVPSPCTTYPPDMKMGDLRRASQYLKGREG